MIKNLVILVFLLSATSAKAGIRTVGNGGGFGEMKANLAFQQMGRQIQTCFAVPALCLMNDAQKNLLVRVLQALPSELRAGGIQFFNDPSLVRTVQTEDRVGAVISLNSSLLTSEDGIARSFEQISGYVLYGLLLHQTTQVTPDLFPFSASLFSGLQESLSTLPLTVEGFNLSLHQMQILNSQDSSVILEGVLLEDPANTYDLISDSDLAAYCPTPQDLATRVKGFRPGSQSTDISVQVDWSCDGKNWGQADLLYHLHVNNQGVLAEEPHAIIRGLIKPETLD